MYKIYFGNRFIKLLPLNEKSEGHNSDSHIICKNKKSFDNAYIKFQKDESISTLNVLCPNPKVYFKHIGKTFKIIKAAGGLIENNEGKILVMKRNGMWDLPKGKIEKGEKKKQAALREVEEECGIKELKIINKIGNSYHTYLIENIWVLKTTYWYKMLYTGNDIPVPQTIEGITEIHWVNNDQLVQIIEIAYPNLRNILEFGIQG